jgi:hypothetical protein
VDIAALGALMRELAVGQVTTAYQAHVRHEPLARLQGRAGRRDPYPLYEEIRRRGDLSPTPWIGYQSASHRLCRAVLRDRRWSVAGDGPRRGHGQLSFLEMDPPDHTRLRRLAAPAFSPRVLPGFEARILAVVDSLLDAAAADRFDLVSGLAAPMPITVITDLLGVADADAGAFARYGATIGSALSGVRSVPHAVRLLEANRRLGEIFAETFAAKRRQPGEDLVSRLVAAGADEVAPDELVPLCTLLLIAGFETTVNLIGNTVLALLEHPDQWHAVVSDPSLAGAAVEETLRYDPPVQRTLRVLTEDAELAGQPLRRGQGVLLLLAGANRDPEAFPDPHRFDLSRTGQPEHLAFSAGIHYCLGAPLARLEAAVAVRRLAERFPGLQRAGRLRRRSGPVIRGLVELPLRTGSRSRTGV